MFNLFQTAHAAEDGGLSIHLDPTVIGHAGTLPITNTMLTAWVVIFLLVFGSYLLKSRLKMMPGRTQLVVEMLIGGAYDFVRDTLEDDKLARRVFPLILTLFIFILAANWIGLIPGVASIGFYDVYHGEEVFKPFLYPAHTDLNLTLALAIIAFMSIEVIGIIMLGFWKYGSKFINFSSPIKFFIGIIEFISEFVRLVSFSFRLFGNIFAGKLLLTIAIGFIPFVLPMPVYALEMFVGLLQAFIFALLTLMFIKMAVAEPH